MNVGRATTAATPATTRDAVDSVDVTLNVVGTGLHAAGRLVVGGFASRAGLDVDQIADLRLVVGALLQQPPAKTSLELTLSENDHGVDIRIGPFAPPSARARASRRALGVLTDDFAVEASEHGDWIAVTLNRRSVG